ncbi:AAA family ATPase [Falsiroseomonas sp. HC035]|uniref:AAA family ATPase n=1 Tax=Falsiroseomonas sp. HC035 TaxID=3390999 RepID=UPI003D3192B1
MAGTFHQIAEVLRSTQRAAIEVENAPEKRKRLRTFSMPEAATLLGVPQKVLRAAVGAPGRPAPPRLSFDDLQRARSALGARRHLGASQQRLPTVVFTNFKGGSAKTTSSVHFAQYMALAGYRVLLVDLDSQGSATAQFGLDPATEVLRANSFAAWTHARDAGVPIPGGTLCQPTYWPTISLVPAGAALAEAEESLSRRAVSGEPEAVLYFEELEVFLASVAGQFDLAVVDTRPDVNMLMTAALHAATGIIVPTRATMTDLASTGEFFSHLAGYVSDFQAGFGKALGLVFSKILVSAYDPSDRSQEALLELLRDRFGDAVLASPFLNSRVMGTAGFGKETLYEYEPTTDRAAYNRVLASANAVNRAIEQELTKAASLAAVAREGVA